MSDSAIDRLARGPWTRVHPGVYVLTAVPPSWHQELKAAQLWLGNEAAISHRAAALLLELEGVRDEVVEFTIVGSAKTPRPGVIVHRAALPSCDVQTSQGFPVTTPTRTLVDLGGVVSPEILELALEDALRRGLTSVPRLKWRLEDLCVKGRTGCGPLRDLLGRRETASGPTESALETRLSRALASRRLPPPVRQHVVRHEGRFVGRVDFAYPDRKVAIEADGYRFHSGRAAWQGDLRRRNALAAAGWQIVHVTAADLRNPGRLLAMIEATLASRPSRRSERP